ncbi:hypothetical protein Tco_0575590 [Tanacetum coccineum]
MLAPKGSTYNGRPTFANPMYLKKAQSEKPCLYEIPYDTSGLANRFIPNREKTLTLEQESKSKLNKDLVKPYDYTKQNSLYEIFKPPSQEYLDQLARANEIRKNMWRKSFVKTKPNIFKNISFLPTQKSLSKSRQAYNVMIQNINLFKLICDQAWQKHVNDHFSVPTAKDMSSLVEICLMPLAIKIQDDSFKFVHELKQEMFADFHDMNARTKKPKEVPISARKPKRKVNKSVATSHKKTVASDPTIQKSKGYFRELYENTNKAWKWLKLVLSVLVSAVKRMLILLVQVSVIEVNPVIYTSYFEQFWATAKVQTVNGVRQIQALVDKKRVIVTESSIRRDLHLNDAEGTGCLPTTTIFEELARMGYEKSSQKLTFYKSFFSPQWKYYIHTITQCLSAKYSAWNEFGSSMASLIICLATNQKFNLSKYIFDAMVKHLDGGVKFLFLRRVCFEKRIQRLERRKISRPTGLKRLKKVGMSQRVEPFEDQESLGVPKDASKQGNETDDSTAGEAVTTAGDDSVVPTTNEEITLAQTLIQIKVAKPQVVTTAATTATTIRPKDKGIVVIVKEPIPLKRKDQIALDEQIARDIQAKLDVELLEEKNLARKQEEESNIALIESWENTQAMIEGGPYWIVLDEETTNQRKGEEFDIKGKAKLFMETEEERRKHFACN